ncbi:MAG TPA: hypothetical protein VLK57_13465 [Pseudonocardia sp.]|jgi:hypothetical protein|nr:hypothetical protein [Pseudonocardia sp.]
MERDGLFIDDLLETLSRVRAAPATESPDVTTQALGEEGDQLDDVVVTSQALGEEGDQADDQSIESGWGYSSAENDLYLDQPADSDDDDVPFDTAF